MEIESINIEVTRIKNGVIGNVSIILGGYNRAVTPTVFYPTLSRALDELSMLANDPDTIVLEHQVTNDLDD